MAEKTHLSKQKAADRLDDSTRTIDRLRAAGELDAIKLSNSRTGRFRIDIGSLAAYEARQRERQQPATAEIDFDLRFPVRALAESRARKETRASGAPAPRSGEIESAA